MAEKKIIVKEEIKEKRDEITFEDLERETQKAFIRNFLKSKHNKLNQNFEIRDGNFNKYENKINYMSDIFWVPNIKNKIYSNSEINTRDIHDKMDYLKLNESIEKPVQQYINTLKIKYQQEKDYIENICRNDNEKALDNNYSRQIMALYKSANDDIKNFINAEHSDYIIFKYDRYNKVDFASQREKDVIYKNMAYSEKNSKKKKIFEGFVNNILKKIKLKESEDIYIY